MQKSLFPTKSQNCTVKFPTAGEELAERQAAVKMLTSPRMETNGEPLARLPSEQNDAYRRICARLAILNKKEDDYLTQQGFTEQTCWSRMCAARLPMRKNQKSVGGKISRVDEHRCAAAETFPGFHGRAQRFAQRIRAGSGVENHELISCNHNIARLGIQATNFERVEAIITELQQKKESAQANLKYFTDHLEHTHIDEALNEDKASNISIIQSPTPPVKGWSTKFKKKVGMLAVSGIAAGLGLAL